MESSQLQTWLWLSDAAPVDRERTYALLATTALVSDHGRPAELMLQVADAYARSGLVSPINEWQRRAMAEMEQNPVAQDQQAEFAELAATDPEAFTLRRLEAIDRSLVQEYIALQAVETPEYDAKLDQLNSEYFNNSWHGKTAITAILTSIFHNKEVLRTFNSRHEAPIWYGLLYGDKDHRPGPVRLRQRLSTVRRKLLSSNPKSRTHTTKLLHESRIWAAIWAVYGGRSVAALRAKDPLVTGLGPNDISQIMTMFNRPFELRPPRGPIVDPDIRFLRDVPANRRKARFR